MTRQSRHGSAGLEVLLEHHTSEGTGVSRLLSAACRPAHSDELAGLADARTAFVQAFAPAAQTRPTVARPAATSVAGRLLALKAAAALTGPTLVGGVAFAAAQTHFLTGTTTHHPRAPQVTQPGAPQGSAIGSGHAVVLVGGHGTSVHGAPGHDSSPGQRKGAASSHASVSHAPHPHPSDSRPPSPPASSRSSSPTKPHPHPSNDASPSHPSPPSHSPASAAHVATPSASPSR